MNFPHSMLRGARLSIVAGVAVIAFTGTTALAVADSDTSTSTPDSTSPSTTPIEITPETDSTSTPTLTEDASTTPLASTTDSALQSPTPVSSSIQASTTDATSSANLTKKPDGPLACTSAYTDTLYDTRTGHALPNATAIGIQAWIVCESADGQKYEFRISPEAYAALGQPDVKMPTKYASSGGQIFTRVSNTTAVADRVTPQFAATSTDNELPPVTKSASSTEATSTTLSDTPAIASTTEDSSGTEPVNTSTATTTDQ